MQLDTDIRICLSLKIHLPSLMRKYYWMSKHYITFYTSFSKNYFFTDGTIPFLLVNRRASSKYEAHGKVREKEKCERVS